MVEYPALDRLPVPLFRADEKGRVTWANEAWEEVLSSRIGDLWHDDFTAFDAASASDSWHSCVLQHRPVNLRSPVRGRNGDTLFYEVLLQPALVDGRPEILGSLVDVTEQTVAVAETSAILDTAVDGIIIIDEHGRIETFNQAASELFGYSHAELTARSGADLLRAGGERVLDRLWRGTQDAKPLHVESFARRKDGDPLEVDVMGTRFDYAGEECVLVVVRDITERKRLEAELRRLAATDDLTGLFNRRRFIELGERELARATRYESPLSLILFDLDYFKRVNDTHGHLAGSRVLREVGGLLASLIDIPEAIVCRYGGDEFVVAVPGCDLAVGVDLAERVREAILDQTFCSTEDAELDSLNLTGITCSCGVATLQRHVEPSLSVKRAKATLLKLADSAMYVAKETGRNRTAIAGEPVRRRSAAAD